MPRPYRSDDHLHDVIRSDAGAIYVHPIRADDVYFDVAWSNSIPANLPESRNGSHVLDIGRGVQVRASGNAQLNGGGDVAISHMSAKQYPSGRDLTAAQLERTRALIGSMILAWAATHAGDLAQADDIDRNNAARTLEEAIERHEAALRILRDNLEACQEGQGFSRYPNLPTDR